MPKPDFLTKFFLLLALLTLGWQTVVAQTTAFTYQGKLTDSGNPANGNYDMQFKLFDMVTAGTQQGTTLTNPTVQVTAGSFSVQLDFGTNVFTGAARFLEIGVRPAGSPNPYTVLSPRQPMTSTPYAIKSQNAATADGLSVACVSCVTSSQIQSVSGSAVTGTIPVASVPAGSNSYIQNSTTQQATSNFNISGNGIIGGNVGIGTTTPQARLNVNGTSWFQGDTTPLGAGAGKGTAVGYGSVGYIFAFDYATFQPQTLALNAPGGNVGIGTPTPNTRLSLSGGPLWTENGWTASMNLQNVSALGWEANSSGQRFGIGQTDGGLYFFRTTSPFGATTTPAIYDMTITDGGNVGIGTTTPGAKLHVVNITDPDNLYAVRGSSTGGIGVLGESTSGWGVKGLSDNSYGVFGQTNNPNSYAGFFQGDVHVTGKVSPSPGVSGSTPMCFNAFFEIATCSSALRYKTAIQPFVGGLDLIKRLHPITFTWKQGGMRDVGFGAEDVEKVEPLLTFRNSKGEVEGVKYDRLSAAFVNAFKEQLGQIVQLQAQLKVRQRQAARQQQQLEQYRTQLAQQQAQINQQQARFSQQQTEVATLKRLLCRQFPKAAVCKASQRVKRS